MNYNAIIEKSDFFRKMHVWPIDNTLNYRGWLDNFSSDEEKKIASSILDFFIFFPKQMIIQMLRTVVGYCGNYLKPRYPNWQHNDFKNKCIYSFIPGETKNPTDSGHIFLRYLRNKLHIPEERLVDFSNLFSLLNEAPSAVPVIFIDDFVGSGAQCVDAWNRAGSLGKTLDEIALNSAHTFIYAPLISNHLGYNRIKDKCRGLALFTCHILSNEYNLFHPDCLCWRNNGLYREGTELILSKSKELGIPFSEGSSVNDVKGFGEQGLALAFDHGAPDAIPPFFYWCDNWTPLIKREYKR